MGRPHGAVLVLGALLQGAAGCDLAVVTACSQAATLALGQCKATSDKLQCCTGAAVLETCIVTNGTDCGSPEPAAIMAASQQSTAYRAYLTSTMGFECSQGVGLPTKAPIELSSGDSGSDSGSGRSALSGSASGSMMWQWVVLVLCFCCCIAGAGGGAAYTMNGKNKKRGKKSGGRGYDEEQDMQSPVPIEQEMPPMQEENMQQEMLQAPIYEQPPPMQEVVQTTEVAEVEPLLFGPTPGLLPGPSSSTVVSGGQAYSYPVAAPQTTSEYLANSSYYQTARPMTTSNYTSGYPGYQVASPQTTSNVYTAPAYGNYTTPAYTAGTGNYYTGAAPQYATTQYSGGGVI